MGGWLEKFKIRLTQLGYANLFELSLAIRILKTTSTKFPIFSPYFKLHTENESPSLAILYFPGWVGCVGNRLGGRLEKIELRLTQLG